MPSSPDITLVPTVHLRFSPDGHSLLSWVHGTLQVLDAATLAPRWPHIEIDNVLAGPAEPGGNGAEPEPEASLEPDNEITDAHFSPDGSHVDALTASTDRAGASRLWEFDAASGAERRRIKISEIGGGSRFALLPGRDAAIVLRARGGPLWWDSTNGVRELPSLPAQTSALALAPDASSFAHATTTNAVLTSTRSLTWLSPPMPVAGDAPTHLGFTRDGRGLIGRGERGLLSYWDVSPDLRPIAQLAREAGVLNPDPTKFEHGVAPALTDAERQMLRANDLGAPYRAAPQAPAVRYPPRRADMPANLFDLEAFYNVPIAGGQNELQPAGTYELAPGRHRFLGVDYDARGAIVLGRVKESGARGDRQPPGPKAVRGIRPGIPRFAALDILMTGGTRLVSHEKHPYAFVELDYADGSRERIAILYGADVYEAWSDRADDGVARVAWRSRNIDHRIFHVRSANPHPERPVRSIAIAASKERWSGPSILAITAEAVEPPHGASVTLEQVPERHGASEDQRP